MPKELGPGNKLVQPLVTHYVHKEECELACFNNWQCEAYSWLPPKVGLDTVTLMEKDNYGLMNLPDGTGSWTKEATAKSISSDTPLLGEESIPSGFSLAEDGTILGRSEQHRDRPCGSMIVLSSQRV